VPYKLILSIPRITLGAFTRIPLQRLRPRSLWRSRAPFTADEARRTERWLATARLFLTGSALLAAWMDQGQIRSIWGYALLDFYVIHGLVITFLLRSRQRTTTPFLLLVHAADVVLPGVISLFTTGQSNPFFLFFLFVIAAAAYRWGLWETVVTSIASVSLLWVDSLAFRSGAIDSLNLWLTRIHLPTLSADAADFEPKRLFMRSIYLVVMGLLLGYLADQQKKLRAEKDQAASLLAMIRVDAGLTGNLSQIVSELLKLYGAAQALIVSRERGTQKVWVGIVEPNGNLPELEWVESRPDGFETYLGDSSWSSCYASAHQKGGTPTCDVLSLSSDHFVLVRGDTSLRRIFDLHSCTRFISVSYSFGPELSGRIFLLEPVAVSNPEEELMFLHNLVRQIGPAIYNVYLLRRLRRKAGALERARLVRELHDGAVQSLIGVEMQVDVLRRNQLAGPLRGELDRIQQLLREEVLKLRELMQQMKSSEVDARKLPGFLRDAVQRFQRETGIGGRFLMDDAELSLPEPICRELARIAQEALVNVRKHSGAKQVVVQLLETNGIWELIIEDDGVGFPFSGRVSQIELDSAGRAPAIIRERVRLIQGELTIDSKPGRGARIEVRVPELQAALSGV
jgi:signal transduction histidine kinase